MQEKIKKLLEKSELEKFKSENVWSLGNDVLYGLCRKYKTHKSESEIIAKIWLIGRVYAATIERRKAIDKDINDDFYIKKVVPQILKSDIDNWINESKRSNKIDVYLKTHKLVTNLFFKISGQNKRSLASKYLHFHLPNKFYIYDTRVVNSINKLLKYFGGNHFNFKKYPLCDEEYKKFYLKCEFARNKIYEKRSSWLNCRQLDNLLIEIANEEIKNKLSS